MEQYAWLEPRHDPIVRDTNFAEIDFENFKNDDLAYAFSCGVSYNSWIMFLMKSGNTLRSCQSHKICFLVNTEVLKSQGQRQICLRIIVTSCRQSTVLLVVSQDILRKFTFITYYSSLNYKLPAPAAKTCDKLITRNAKKNPIANAKVHYIANARQWRSVLETSKAAASSQLDYLLIMRRHCQRLPSKNAILCF